jgi:arsenate reductase (thioredoxin)
MKKILFALIVLFSGILVTSFNTAAPKLYPELEAYFKSIDGKQFNQDHRESLENIKYSIASSSMDYEDWNLIFYCSENTFRSQASQVFAQTLCYAKKHRKVKVYSAGLTTGEISPQLITYLQKIGYRITHIQKDGKAAYEVKFSDQAPPIVLFSKTTTDPSLPIKDISSIIVCDVAAEADCASLITYSSKPFHLAFPRVVSTDEAGKAEATLKSIASEIVYVTNK